MRTTKHLKKLQNQVSKPPLISSFMDIGFGSGILLDLVLFADRTNAEPKSYLSIFWDIGGLQRFERHNVYIFLAVCFKNS